jgi:hypothetical protein
MRRAAATSRARASKIGWTAAAELDDYDLSAERCNFASIARRVVQHHGDLKADADTNGAFYYVRMECQR